MRRAEVIGLVGSLLSFTATVVAAENPTGPIADCAGVTDIKSKSRQLFEGQTLMVTLATLEAQGEAQFRPKYSRPLVAAVLNGSAAPLATVRWPAGAKEPVIDAYDSKRLK